MEFFCVGFNVYINYKVNSFENLYHTLFCSDSYKSNYFVRTVIKISFSQSLNKKCNKIKALMNEKSF